MNSLSSIESFLKTRISPSLSAQVSSLRNKRRPFVSVENKTTLLALYYHIKSSLPPLLHACQQFKPESDLG